MESVSLNVPSPTPLPKASPESCVAKPEYLRSRSLPRSCVALALPAICSAVAPSPASMRAPAPPLVSLATSPRPLSETESATSTPAVTASALIARISESSVSWAANVLNVNVAPERSVIAIDAGALSPAPPLRLAVRTVPTVPLTREPVTEPVPVSPKRPRSRAVCSPMVVANVDPSVEPASTSTTAAGAAVSVMPVPAAFTLAVTAPLVWSVMRAMMSSKLDARGVATLLRTVEPVSVVGPVLIGPVKRPRSFAVRSVNGPLASTFTGPAPPIVSVSTKPFPSPRSDITTLPAP